LVGREFKNDQYHYDFSNCPCNWGVKRVEYW